MDTIFHITAPSLWESSVLEGTYAYSTREATLSDVGFIHCSFKHQVEKVANYIYDDWDGPLLILEAEPGQIPSEIRIENLDGGSEGFPHIYGPLPIGAVKAVHHLVRHGGAWTFPEGL